LSSSIVGCACLDFARQTPHSISSKPKHQALAVFATFQQNGVHKLGGQGSEQTNELYFVVYSFDLF
jgi:hypothetical protein